MTEIKDMATITVTPQTMRQMQLIVDTLVDALNELARLVRKVVESIVETVRAFEAATEDGRSFPGVVSTFPRLGRGH